MSYVETFQSTVETVLGSLLKKAQIIRGDLVLEVSPENYLAACQKLRDDSACKFEILIDLCGVDYSTYREGEYDGPRYYVVLQLLSIAQNQRIRVKVACADDEMPLLPSLVNVWPNTNWFEREVFDMYGVVFEGHPDLRRILTDYGFIGHPQRKDFPISGHVEMIYDEKQQRVVYQPVTIEPREIIPRVIREDGYGGVRH
ncbi:NADH-quinone oxidoreductase chain 5 [Saezia sanguinis]|uniref:NADH-quinone oxidoreductase subunit C n=1 Tax=Saezia sanguinis TaxID=1965230 RepID=A0A433SH64_9BURK|nr:NADH-quinone oxidoreductase subunit C [Saezia sanguinis]RUS68046.1 NADH-quinone oxidoreductase chain 5 [Saezia sanguinis]